MNDNPFLKTVSSLDSLSVHWHRAYRQKLQYSSVFRNINYYTSELYEQLLRNDIKYSVKLAETVIKHIISCRNMLLEKRKKEIFEPVIKQLEVFLEQFEVFVFNNDEPHEWQTD